MTRYLVLEPGAGRSAEAVFLRDRFHVVAFLVPFLWLAAHRLYLFAALALLVQGGLWALGGVDGFGFASSALGLLFGLAVALEGPRLVAWRLRRRGYREAAGLHAADLDEAELFYYGAAGPAERAESEAVAEPAPVEPSEPRATPPLLGWRSARTLLDPGHR